MYPNLKLEIWRSGLRQNRLALELEIDETLLSKVINGYRRPSSQLRNLLANYFQKDETWLFREELDLFARSVSSVRKRHNGHQQSRAKGGPRQSNESPFSQ